MHAQAFVEHFAGVLGIDADELTAIDRYLASAGLREKARGRSYPEIKLTEGLRILLGVMAARTPAQAVNDISSVERFTLAVHGVSVERGSVSAFKSYIGASLSELEEMPLIDVLRVLVKHLVRANPQSISGQKVALRGPLLWLKIMRGGPVILQVDGEDYKGEINFIGAVNFMSGDLYRTSTVGVHTLLNIGWNCEAD